MNGPRIPIARPSIDVAAASAAATRVLASGWVTQGPEVQAFEREFASWVGAPYACAVSSGTTALHLALLAAGVGPGDEVITVSHSFIASANAIRYCGATPVFVDIDPQTFNIDTSLVERALSDRTRAIMCVHQIGMPCDLRFLVPFARERGIGLIEDAACAAGSEIRWDARGDRGHGDGEWQRIGRPHGDAACFSFHPRKLLTTGDGGMITTGRDDWDERFRRWRQHGMGVPDRARHGSPTVVLERYAELGFNYRLTDLQASLGRTQLADLDGVISRRRAQAARYGAMLSGLTRVRLPSEPDGVRTNWQSYCVVLDKSIDCPGVMQTLLDRGIATRPAVMNAHQEPAYPDGTWRAGSTLIESERIRRHGLILPLYDALTADEQADVVNTLRQAIG